MIASRDSRDFIKGNVPWNKRLDSAPREITKTSLVVRKARSRGVTKLKRVPVVRKEIRGGVGVLKPERVRVICPACGQQVEAVARDGRVKGYCGVARQSVDFLIETQLERR